MAKVSFVRGTDAQIEELEVTEGQIIVSESGALYVDTDTERIPISASEETIVAVYDTTTATSAHAVDSYVYVNDHLYVVTVAIAVGDTIAVGTNVALATNLDANTPVYISGLPSSSGGDGGIPEGGTTGQVLVKLSNSDYDVGWGNATGGGVGTVVNIITTTPSFHNKTVTLTGTYATYTATFDNTGHASVNVYYVDTYDIACEGFHNSVNVTAIGLVYAVTLDADYKNLVITAANEDMYGEMISLKINGVTESSVTFDTETGIASVRVGQTGTWQIFWDGQGVGISQSQNVTVSELDKADQAVIFYGTKVNKTFAAATDAEIASMVAAADNGSLDLYDDCGWRVGQEHSVDLAAMAATGVGESHAAQSVTFVLMNKGGKTLNTPTASGRTTCSFVVGLKDSLKEKGYMNSSNTNTGGWTSSARRTWCNSVFKGALPVNLAPIFKQFENKTSVGNQSTTITTDVDWFALPSEIEIFGSTTYSASGEGTQFTWYETAANRIKKVNGSADAWWERSPRASDTTFCIALYDGSAGNYNASGTYGLAPFGVI